MPRPESQGSVLDDVREERVARPSGLEMGPSPPAIDPPFGWGDPFASPGPADGPPVSNARLGMAIFLSFEAMLFAGLIGAFLMFRMGSAFWPPPGQPRLPIAVTWVNTAILLFSGYTMRSALGAARIGDPRALGSALSGTALLGTLFLAVQGTEWLRLIRHGLTMQAGIYGATFYTLIGFHGLHVLGAVIWLAIVRLGMRRGRLAAGGWVGVELCGMYWYFVVALWPILFGLVYLS
jgi:heme/copper-type cytochrome/quinol oxidase subunit 3